MSLEQHILTVWQQQSYYPIPELPLIHYAGEYMATIDDTQDFVRFMNAGGQIFLTLRKNIYLAKPPDLAIGNVVYACDKAYPILCGPSHGSEEERDNFVLNNIAYML